jgi:hypothetical protein
VLAYDAAAHHLYVAAESGIITVLDIRNHRLAMIGSPQLLPDPERERRATGAP